MARNVPMDEPLSDEDREYLHARGLHSTVDMLDDKFGEDDYEEDDGTDVRDPGYENWTGPELEAELARRGLAKSGTNADKAARLREDDAKAQP